MNTCSTCRFLSEYECTFLPTRVAVHEPEKYFCGQWRSIEADTGDGTSEKITDWDIMDFFEKTLDMEVSVAHTTIAAKYSLHERTVARRLKRLVTLGLIARTKFDGTGEHYCLGTFKDAEDKHIVTEAGSRAYWEAKLAKRKPEHTVTLRAKAPEWVWDDIAGAFALVNATEAAPKSFTQIYQAARSQGAVLGKGAFTRLLAEAVTAGRLARNDRGEYGLKS